jgi:mono/diheme cytochrome c family protein
MNCVVPAVRQRWAMAVPAAAALMIGCATTVGTPPAGGGAGGGGGGAANTAALAALPGTPGDTTTGRRVYAQACGLCHNQQGRGTPGVFPPIIGSEWVTGPADVPILIVLHGITGPIQVAGNNYNTEMPGWGADLSDAEIAGVVSLIRQWGANDAGPVTVEAVRAIRAATANRTRPMTAAELRPGS